MAKNKIFSSLIDNKRESSGLIMTSVLVAVGVNMLSTGIVDLLGLRFGFQIKEVILITIGIFLSLGVLAWNAWTNFRRLNQTKKFEGFIIYDEINHKIISVPEYTISTDMAQYQQWASSENKALEKLWKEDNISQFRNFRGKIDQNLLNTLTQSGTLLTELLEYCLIEKLSLHLTDYYNKFDGKLKVQKFQKTDIPQVLLTNRFLRLFSEDMINRESFMCLSNNFNDENDDLGVSKEGYQFMAGILAHIREITLLTNPLVNSYKRLVPGYEAPIYIAWSMTNRSPLIRIPVSRGSRTRVELRCPDSAANPYLTLAVCLEAGLDGIRRQIDPPAAVTENIFEMRLSQIKKQGIESLPADLGEAVEAFKADPYIREVLGEHISEKYSEAKMAEWADYRAQVTGWEIDNYLYKI